ncbi:MAG: tetratricopeptide repeat protein, partial [Deltaproteobacteria bacterium]|nr:tetratricopeptide repeat protein [Deltaproteobacteria bacterium]
AQGCSGYEDIRKALAAMGVDEAIALIDKYIKDFPDFAEAHNDLGVFYYRYGNKIQALGHYEKAVRLCPANTTFRKNLASFYFIEMGWTDDAIRLYTDILASQPSDVEVLTALGIISKTIGRPEEAGIFFRRVLDYEPWNDEARSALSAVDAPMDTDARMTSAEGSDDMVMPSKISEIDEILASLRHGAPSRKEPIENLYGKALKLAEEGKLDDAISDLHALLNRNMNNGLIHNDLGVLYSRIGENGKALMHHEKAVGLNPANSTFRKNLASLYYSAVNRADDAIALYSALLKESPNDVDILSALAIISIDNNRPDEARIFLNKIVELEPANSDARKLAEQLSSGNKGFFLAAG